jgi:hypothetical protein
VLAAKGEHQHDRRQKAQRGDRDEFVAGAAQAGAIDNCPQYDDADRPGEDDKGGLKAGPIRR